MDEKIVALIVEKNYWEKKKNKLLNNSLTTDWYMKWALVVFLLPSVMCLNDKKRDSFLLVFGVIGVVFFLLVFLTGLLTALGDYFYRIPRYQKKLDKVDHQIIEELKKIKKDEREP